MSRTDAARIVVPLTNAEITSLWVINEDWQKPYSNFLGEINSRYRWRGLVGFAEGGRSRRIMSWRPAWATHFNCLSYWLRKNLTEAPEEKEGFSLAHDFMVSIMMGKS